MFSNQAGVLHKLQRRAGGKENEKKVGGKGQSSTSLIAQIPSNSTSTNLSNVFIRGYKLTFLILFLFDSSSRDRLFNLAEKVFSVYFHREHSPPVCWPKSIVQGAKSIPSQQQNMMGAV